MSRIFAEAMRVLIWLGEEDDAAEVTAKAFACMDILIQRVYPRIDELDGWQTVNRRTWDDMAIRNVEEISLHFNIPTPDSIEFTSLDLLFQRSWFSRAWTFQESWVAKERTFHCGSYQIAGDDMLGAVLAAYRLYKCTDDKRYHRADSFNSLSMTTGVHFWNQMGHDNPINFLTLLIQRRGSGCKDPRDLIYALVGAAQDSPDIDIDYDRPYQYVYACSTASIISHTGRLSVLKGIYQRTSLKDLSSWVPDWRMAKPSEGFGNQSFTKLDYGALYLSTGSSLAVPKLSPCARELTLVGINWDLIASLRGCLSSELPEWIQEQFPKSTDYEDWYKSTGESIGCALKRTLCSDRKLFGQGNTEAR